MMSGQDDARHLSPRTSEEELKKNSDEEQHQQPVVGIRMSHLTPPVHETHLAHLSVSSLHSDRRGSSSSQLHNQLELPPFTDGRQHLEIHSRGGSMRVSRNHLSSDNYERDKGQPLVRMLSDKSPSGNASRSNYRRKLHSDSQLLTEQEINLKLLKQHTAVTPSQSRRPASKQISNESSKSVVSVGSGGRIEGQEPPPSPYLIRTPDRRISPQDIRPHQDSTKSNSSRRSHYSPYVATTTTGLTTDVKSLLTYTKCFMIAAYFVFLCGSAITVHPLIQFLMKDSFSPSETKWIAGVVLLILGVISLLGLYGSLKEDSCVLLIYGVIILFVFVAHVILLFHLKSICSETQKKCYRNMATPPGLAPILVAISELAMSMCSFFMLLVIESERKVQREGSRISTDGGGQTRQPTFRVKPRGSLQI